VNALHAIHAVLVPGGVLVDTQPVSAHPPVAAGDDELGRLDMREWSATIERVDALVARVVADGRFALEAQTAFTVTDTFDDGAELVGAVSDWEGTRIPRALARRVAAARPPIEIRQEVRLRLLRALPSA
jgi:hypothetical protein